MRGGWELLRGAGIAAGGAVAWRWRGAGGWTANAAAARVTGADGRGGGQGPHSEGGHQQTARKSERGCRAYRQEKRRPDGGRRGATRRGAEQGLSRPRQCPTPAGVGKPDASQDSRRVAPPRSPVRPKPRAATPWLRVTGLRVLREGLLEQAGTGRRTSVARGIRRAPPVAGAGRPRTGRAPGARRRCLAPGTGRSYRAPHTGFSGAAQSDEPCYPVTRWTSSWSRWVARWYCTSGCPKAIT